MNETPKVFIARGRKVCDSRALAQYYGIDHNLAISRLQATLDIDPDCEALFWEPDYLDGETQIRFLVTLHGAAVHMLDDGGVPVLKFQALVRAFGHVGFNCRTDALMFGPANGVKVRA